MKNKVNKKDLFEVSFSGCKNQCCITVEIKNISGNVVMKEQLLETLTESVKQLSAVLPGRESVCMELFSAQKSVSATFNPSGSIQ